jgi:hypothetical protein
MWYSEDVPKQALDYSKPIFARATADIDIYLLLPQIAQGSYEVIGYNWFNLTKGEYNSCITFSTIVEALKVYKRHYNATITICRG